jgi:hypothetical protein
MKIAGNNHTTRWQTNLLQDGIGRYWHQSAEAWRRSRADLTLAEYCGRRGIGNTIT